MEVKEQSKAVELWLTKEEKDNKPFLESLKLFYQQYKEQNYVAAVFHSGEKHLYQQPRDLLIFNRWRAAKKEVQEGCIRP